MSTGTTIFSPLRFTTHTLAAEGREVWPPHSARCRLQINSEDLRS